MSNPSTVILNGAQRREESPIEARKEILRYAQNDSCAGLPGVLDPNSIVVVDVGTGEDVRHATTEGFVYGDKGRIEWVIEDQIHKEYEIRFGTAHKRPPLMPAKHTPLIGVGDLLRYNAGVP